MSTCPECDLCPYFGEGTTYEASSVFQEMALKFIALYKYSIPSEDFKLADIHPSEIDKFYIDDSRCCFHCKPNLEEERYFLPVENFLPFYIDDKNKEGA